MTSRDATGKGDRPGPPLRDGTGSEPVTALAALAGRAGLVRLGGVPRLRDYLRDLWSRREFAVTVPLGELRAQHMNSVLGGAWHLLNPLLSAAVYYLVFGVILGAQGDVPNYPAFLVIGLFVFYYTQKTLVAGSRTVVANLRLIQNLTFPRAVLPLAAVLSETIAQVPAVAVMFGLVLLTGVAPALDWLGLVAVYVLLATFNLGIALLVGRATFHFRDVEQLLPYVLRLWLYLSGVLFATSRVPEGWPRTLFELNPMFAYVDLARSVLLYDGAEATRWGLAVAWSVTALVAGFRFFWRGEASYGRGW